MKHIVECTVGLKDGATRCHARVVRALEGLGLRPSKRYGLPPSPASVQLVGEFEVSGAAEKLPRGGADFLRNCIVLKAQQHLAESGLPAVLLDVRVDGQRDPGSCFQAA